MKDENEYNYLIHHVVSKRKGHTIAPEVTVVVSQPESRESFYRSLAEHVNSGGLVGTIEVRCYTTITEASDD